MKKISKCLSQKTDNFEYVRANELVFSGEKIKEKEIVLKYITSFKKPTLATTGRVKDNISGETLENKCDNAYIIDGFYWDETDIYHFEKYNMPLKQEFIDYILSK